MTANAAPTAVELHRRATELVPLLREHARRADDDRRLPDEVVTALADAGLLRMRVPLRFGGHESSMQTLVDVLTTLARGDGAAAWTVSVWTISSWMVGLFPDEVQDVVFADPDVRVCGIISPTAQATPVEGGYRVDGQWAFNTAALLSDWNTNAAVIAHPDGSFEPAMVLIPSDELSHVDDWETVGMRGTGSVTSIADGVFVPEARVMSMGPVIAGQHSSVVNAASPVFNAPFLPTACTIVSAVAAGLARAAQDAFGERLPGRKITYTDYADQSAAPVTHLKVAEAAVAADEAEFHVNRCADRLDDAALAEEEWKVADRVQIRLDMGAATKRAQEAVEHLASASGASSIRLDVPIQRIRRDISALRLHGIMNPDTNFELFGRVACGLEPNTVYL